MGFLSGVLGVIMIPLALVCFLFAIAIAIENPLGGAISLVCMVLVAMWVRSVIKEDPSDV